jgi:hypothetical protein
MSLGLYDQRARLYGYESTEDTGVVTSVYVFRVERWCRVGSPSAREVTIAAQASHALSAVIAFQDEVTVEPDDLITVGETRYVVRGVTSGRALRTRRVPVEMTDDRTPLLELDES